MRWVYILKCEYDYYYVGETKRLYRRFWEHQNGNGCLNTSTYTPEDIVAIYKVGTLCKFFDYNEQVNNIIDGIIDEEYHSFILRYFDDITEEEQYDNLYAENNIVECLMIHNPENWDRFRGGKYTRFDIEYNYPSNDYIKDLPLCKCGLPCDIKKNEDNNYLYFRCAKKNMWKKLKEEFNIYDEPCNFYMEYIKDKKLKLDEQNRFQERSKLLKNLFEKSYWLKNIDLHDYKNPNKCIGGCNRTSENIKVTYSNKKRNLCFDCFIEDNEELKNKYDIIEEIDF